MEEKNILLLPGDGIGPEVVGEVRKLISFFNKNTDKKFTTKDAFIGGCAYDKEEVPLPQDTLRLARESDAILLGAVGGPKWENVEYNKRPEKGLLKIRKELQLFANLRPAIVFDALSESSSLKKNLVINLDLLIIRELTGGIYFGEPRGIENLNDGSKRGFNTLSYTEGEIERIAKIAFDLAGKRSKKVCSVDKANVLEATQLWREVVSRVGKNYKDVELTHMYVDNAAMQLVKNPKQFDVILTTNMFGDILSDIAAMLTGSLGMLPSASLGEKNIKTKKQLALYEPVHGSAPDIAGNNIANPIAAILSFSMMLKYSFGFHEESNAIDKAVKKVLSNGYRTADIITDNDLNNDKITSVSTSEMGEVIIKEVEKTLL